MKKITVEECDQISVNRVIRQLVEWWLSCNHSTKSFRELLAKLSRKSFETEFAGRPAVRLRFTTTRCHFGGVRYWFLCPDCDRRVGKLYAHPMTAATFKCRNCHDLTYTTTQTHNDRFYKVYARLQHIVKAQGTEAASQLLKLMMKTFRGTTAVLDIYDKWRDIETPRPNHIGSPHWIRRKNTEEGFDKYVMPLLRLIQRGQNRKNGSDSDGVIMNY